MVLRFNRTKVLRGCHRPITKDLSSLQRGFQQGLSFAFRFDCTLGQYLYPLHKVFQCRFEVISHRLPAIIFISMQCQPMLYSTFFFFFLFFPVKDKIKFAFLGLGKGRGTEIEESVSVIWNRGERSCQLISGESEESPNFVYSNRVQFLSLHFLFQSQTF